MNLEIRFSKTTKKDGPSWWRNKQHWLVSAYEVEAGENFPAGQAWVFEPEPVPDSYQQLPPVVDYVLVADHCRKRGVADQIVLALKARWPNLTFTKGISDGGRRIVEKFS